MTFFNIASLFCVLVCFNAMITFHWDQIWCKMVTLTPSETFDSNIIQLLWMFVVWCCQMLASDSYIHTYITFSVICVHCSINPSVILYIVSQWQSPVHVFLATYPQDKGPDRQTDKQACQRRAEICCGLRIDDRSLCRSCSFSYSLFSIRIQLTLQNQISGGICNSCSCKYRQVIIVKLTHVCVMKAYISLIPRLSDFLTGVSQPLTHFAILQLMCKIFELIKYSVIYVLLSLNFTALKKVWFSCSGNSFWTEIWAQKSVLSFIWCWHYYVVLYFLEKGHA